MKPDSRQLISGPVGNIEVAVSSEGDKGIVIICHPHPQHQGTMDNKVVTMTAKAFRELGLRTVRFNYRGVGNSDGEYGASYGEADDLVAVAKWAREQYGQRLWLGGFSFGCFVAYLKANELAAEQLLLIAPSVERMDFEKTPEPTMPWYIIQGDADEVVSAEATYQLVESAQNTPKLTKLNGVSHFFHGELITLKTLINEHYQELV